MVRVKKFQIESESLIAQLEKVDDKVEIARSYMERISPRYLVELWNQLDISAIYHGCALEGEVISPDELHAALDPKTTADAANMAFFSSIRSHKKAFEISRQIARQNELVYNFDFFNRLNTIFSPFDSDSRGFRKDLPLHRTYFHEISKADLIPEKMNELVETLGDKTEQKTVHPIIWAAKFHHSFMRIFPYTDTSGKVGRMAMNIYLLKNGFLPAVIHSTERQRYYEAIKGSYYELTQLIIDSEIAALDSAIRFLRRAVVR
ncbi:MAG: Fic family protein [Deltaproteobacteria bacterium]|nr:Fic family protein [Deltaproteobacteria bacterium]